MFGLVFAVFVYLMTGIAQFMLNNASNSPRATLEKFLSSEMSLPFGMLSVHRELWLGFTNIPEMSNATLVDFFNMVQTTLQQALLPQWIGFAADCAEQYVAKGGHFIEKSNEARTPLQNMTV